MKKIVLSHIEKLKQLGLEVSNEKALFDNLVNKHYSRYVEVIEFLRRHALPLTQELMEATYRADIVIRRMIDEVLKAFEMSLKTKIMLCAEKLNWSLEKTTCYNIAFDDWSQKRKDFRQKKNNSRTFILESIEKILDKNEDFRYWSDIVNEFQFGQIVSLLQVENDETFKQTFQFDKNILSFSKEVVTNNLELVGQLRNLIAHINIILKPKPFKGQKFSKIKLATSINCLHELVRGDFKQNLARKINDYKISCLKKGIISIDMKLII